MYASVQSYGSKATEQVNDFIRRLEQSFHGAYGTEHITVETRDAQLQGKLQVGLRQAIVMAPAVEFFRTFLS